MNLFSKVRKKDAASESSRTATVFTAPSRFSGHPFSALNNYVPLTDCELSLYRALREAVPIIDAAICKTVRLIGDFKVQSLDTSAQKTLDEFLDSVDCGTAKGIMPFIYSYLDCLLTYGTAVGEMVLSADGSSLMALYNAALSDITLKQGDSPLDIIVCRRDVQAEQIPYQPLVLKTLLNPQPGTCKGTSVMQGLPFVSSVLLKIFNSVGTNWDRVGNVRFAVTYKPASDTSGVTAQKRATEIAEQWSKAMRSKQVCDFVSVGDVSIKVIGAENQIPDCDIPIKHLLEQIVAKLSIPPFLLGLSWSSTERMSSQQADILTSELEYYRTLLNPVIKQICSMWLRLNGCGDGVKIEWSNINLQDETELARARLLNAQAQSLEAENKAKMQNSEVDV
ncbi:MAG: serine/threonine protein phosphatase [Acutalibacteraceae bacterium]